METDLCISFESDILGNKMKISESPFEESNMSTPLAWGRFQVHIMTLYFDLIKSSRCTDCQTTFNPVIQTSTWQLFTACREKLCAQVELLLLLCLSCGMRCLSSTFYVVL